MSITLILFIIGTLGFVLNKKNMMLLFISIEMMLLAITLLMLQGSAIMDDVTGLFYGMMMLMLAGAESAMGLSMLVAYYKLRGSVSLDM
uniref:NADH dehydrogenase subunit 4L n=1 Tax=Saccharomycopsis fibuligera TaxID=4944 RepID=UPI002A827269|nr:NADH dehydrogenase subunit 4L [Saccharomycopsis fibuligera]WPA89461.1 NADH dehydrogenase subunit 4L [Saccharomycopsis fibuligera]